MQWCRWLRKPLLIADLLIDYPASGSNPGHQNGSNLKPFNPIALCHPPTWPLIAVHTHKQTAFSPIHFCVSTTGLLYYSLGVEVEVGGGLQGQHSPCMYWSCDRPDQLWIIPVMLQHEPREDHLWAMTAIDPINLLIILVYGLNTHTPSVHAAATCTCSSDPAGF